MVRFQMFIDREMLTSLKAAQERTGVSVARQIRDAVAAYLEAQNMSPKPQDERQIELDLA